MSKVGIEQFRQAASRIYQRQVTGTLALTNGDRQWTCYFYRGRLMWAEGEPNPIRRWRRALRECCPDWACWMPPAAEVADLAARHALWEYHLLDRAVRHQELSVRQGRQILQAVAREVLFAATYSPVTCHWQPGRPPAIAPDLALPGGALVATLREVRAVQQQWSSLRLPPERVNAALRLRAADGNGPASSNTLLSLQTLLNGQRCFWDVMQQMKQSTSVWTRILHHFVQQGIVEFPPLPDLDPRAVAQAVRPRALVAYIDDDPEACEAIALLLRDARCGCLSICDGLDAVRLLKERRPQLILLNVDLPIANGYELCAQIRRIDGLATVPAILLADRCSLLERVRARLVRASDLVTKPLSAKTLSALLDAHLPDGAGPSSRDAGGGGANGTRPAANRSTAREPGDRKPDNREPGDREPGDRAPGDRKPDNREPGDRAPGDRKPDNREPGDGRSDGLSAIAANRSSDPKTAAERSRPPADPSPLPRARLRDA